MFNPCMFYEDNINQIELICSGVTDVRLSIGNNDYENGSLTFNWGDGQINTFTDGSFRIEKTYSTPFIGKIKISGNLNKVGNFNFGDGEITEGVEYFYNENLYVEVSEFNKMKNLKDLSIGSRTNIDCSFSDFPKTLEDLRCSSMFPNTNLIITGDINDLNLSIMRTLMLDGLSDEVISYTSGIRNPNMHTLILKLFGSFSATVTDTILINLDNYVSLTDGFIILKSLGRTSASNTAYDSLISKGYSITLI